LGAIAQSLRADFHAKTSQPQEREPDSKASAADSGGKRLPPLAWFDPKSSAWKTFQRCLLEGWTLFSDRWPRSGIVCNGIAYLLPTLARRTDMIESGLSESGKIWPTPMAADATQHRTPEEHYQRQEEKKAANPKLGGLHKPLITAILERQMWPTPRANDAEKRGEINPNEPRNGLPGAVKLWPTPVVGEPYGGQGEPPERFRKRQEEQKKKGVNLHLPLSTAVRMWPTPRASEWKGTGPLGSKSHKYRLGKKYLDATVQEANQKTGALNADWVSILMGYSLDWTIVEDGNAESHGSPRGKKTGPKD